MELKPSFNAKKIKIGSSFFVLVPMWIAKTLEHDKKYRYIVEEIEQ